MNANRLLDPSRPELQNLESRMLCWENIDEGSGIPDEYLIPSADGGTLVCAWDRRFFKRGLIIFFRERDYLHHRTGEPAVFYPGGGYRYFIDGYLIEDLSKPNKRYGVPIDALDNGSPYWDDDELDLHSLFLLPRDVAELITRESVQQLPKGTSAAQGIGISSTDTIEGLGFGEVDD